MSEDRLDKALEAMRNEGVAPAQLVKARDRVWESLPVSTDPVCGEFRPDLRDYVDGRLPRPRALLMEDHLSRCPRCRKMLAGLKDQDEVLRVTPRPTASWSRWAAWGAAAAVVLLAFYVGRHRIDSLLAPGGPRATVASLNGALYLVPGGVLQSGAAMRDGETVRTGPGAGAVLQLADGSRVELNERTEIALRSAWSGETIQLGRGDIIVQAAKQRSGQLRVQTRDSVASVKGTVFAVSAGLGGTVVSVIEGSVSVTQPGVRIVLEPGQQAASNTSLRQSVEESVSWSTDADTYTDLLASLAKLEREIAALPEPALRTQSRVLAQIPDNIVIYGAVPNPGGTIDQAMALAELEAFDNPVFREWWDSETGQDLRQIIQRIQSVTPLLGDEIVFGFAIASGTREEIPMVTAEVLPGRARELEAAVAALGSETGGTSIPIHLTEGLMFASDSAEHLQWILERLGRGVASPFASALADRYRRGAGWLVGLDMEPALTFVSSPQEAEFVGAQQMRHLFLERRSLLGLEENEVSLTFKGPRIGMASWLANIGSGGAAEYLSSNAVVALYVATREPRLLFEELMTKLVRLTPSAMTDLAAVEGKLGISLSDDLVAAVGTESAFALDGLSPAGPVWVMAVQVNDPVTLDSALLRLIDVFNSELDPEEQGERIDVVQATADGRDWTTLRSSAAPLSVTWTYDGGYLVAASDRGAASRAIATRNGGASLVWSAEFLQQLPSSAGLHPSAFAWLNTKGAFQGLEMLVTNSTLQKLIAERDPVLVVFGGTTEQIRGASRTRLTGLILDALMLENLSRVTAESEAASAHDGSTPPGTR